MQQLITVNNPLQNLTSAQTTSVSSLGNLSIGNPTVEEINRAISSGSTNDMAEDDAVEPAFGVHLREAAGVIRRVFK